MPGETIKFDSVYSAVFILLKKKNVHHHKHWKFMYCVIPSIYFLSATCIFCVRFVHAVTKCKCKMHLQLTTCTYISNIVSIIIIKAVIKSSVDMCHIYFCFIYFDSIIWQLGC